MHRTIKYFYCNYEIIAVASETVSPGIAARTLANIADMLGGMAGTQGGLRSGPAGNIKWKKAFSYLEVFTICVITYNI